MDRNRLSPAAASWRQRRFAPTSAVVPAASAAVADPGVPASTTIDLSSSDPIITQIAFWALALFLVCAYSRLTDFLYFVLPHALLILAGTTFAAALLNGTIHRGVTSLPGLLLISFTGWACGSVPFGMWPGGSFRFLASQWLKSLMVFFLIVGAATTYKHCRQAMLALAVSCIFLTLVVLARGSMSGGRLEVAFGVLGNANDLALYLLLGLPFCIFAYATRSHYSLLRLLFIGVVLGILVNSLRTGSRAGLVTLLISSAAVFWNVSMVGKAKLVGIAGLTAILALALVPDTVLERLQVWSTRERSYENVEVSRAATSMAGRTRLLMDGIYLTRQNPITGVGVGMYAVGAAARADEEGWGEMWKVAHNSYIEVASECGIPGLLLYLAVLGYCLKTCFSLRWASKNDPMQQDLWLMASCLLLLTVIFGIAGLFSSLSYSIILPTLAGLTEAMRRTTEDRRRSPQAGPAQGSPFEPPRRLGLQVGVSPGIGQRSPIRQVQWKPSTGPVRFQ